MAGHLRSVSEKWVQGAVLSVPRAPVQATFARFLQRLCSGTEPTTPRFPPETPAAPATHWTKELNMKRGFKTATATVALLAAATFAHAQMQDDKGKGPATDGKPPAASQPQAGEPKGGEPKAQPRTAQPEQKGAQDRTTERSKSSEGPPRDTDRQKSSQQQPQDRARDPNKRTENPEPGQQRQQSTEQSKERSQDQPRRADTPQRDMEDKDNQKTTRSKDEPGRDRSKTAQQPKEPKQGERLKVSEQERTRVRDRIRQTRVEKTRINVNISVGTYIPRSVRLHTLPVTIVEYAPEYRGYSYIVLEDETIVIVHPTTYVIVDYIPASSQRAGTQTLVLSSDQLRFVYRTLDREPRSGIRARLALGAEVPRDVDLVDFPGDIVQRVPDLDRYRYVMSDDGVLVVDPGTHEVVLVIDE
jgi:hypothetical protein